MESVRHGALGEQLQNAARKHTPTPKQEQAPEQVKTHAVTRHNGPQHEHVMQNSDAWAQGYQAIEFARPCHI